MEPVPTIAGMTPCACSYDVPDGKRFAITLYSTDHEQIIEDHCADLPGLVVDGKVIGTIPDDRRQGE